MILTKINILIKLKQLEFFIFALLFFACGSSKKISNEYSSWEKLDLEKLNGVYLNVPILDREEIELKKKKDLNFMYKNPSLSNIIFEPYNVFEKRNNFTMNYEGQIQIKVLNEKEVKFIHIISDTIFQQTTLNGNVEGNIFKIEKKNPTGIPLIWGAFRSKYIYLSLNKRNNLDVIFGASHWGGALIIFSGNKNTYKTELEFENYSF